METRPELHIPTEAATGGVVLKKVFFEISQYSQENLWVIASVSNSNYHSFKEKEDDL